MISPLSETKDLHLASLKVSIRLVTSVCPCAVSQSWERKAKEKHPPGDSQQARRSASPSSSVPESRRLSDTHLPERQQTGLKFTELTATMNKKFNSTNKL